MYKKLLPLIQFLPLSLFSTYGFWQNQATNERWIEAFQLTALLGLLQLVIMLFQQKPVNRLILAVNLYLIFGGIAAFFHQWWYLEIYQSLQESAIFVFMLIVGLITTLVTPSGYIAANHLRQIDHRWASWLLFIASIFALFNAHTFQGQIIYSAVIPIILLSLLQRFLRFRLIYVQKNCD